MHPDFALPAQGSIRGRSSSITAAFISTIIPVIEPTDAEVDEALSILGMKRGFCRCAYCGDKTSEWDHFRALVDSKRPTGYITEIGNLVPACGKCNQSKGNKKWDVWIISSALRSPKTRGVSDLDEKIARLRAYEQWRIPTWIDLANLIDEETLRNHWENLENLHKIMISYQLHADKIREMLKTKIPR